MAIDQFVKSQSDLLEIADVLSRLARESERSIFRYTQVVYDSIYVDRGRKNINRCGFSSTYNVEDMASQIYSSIHGEELFCFNLDQFENWRKRSESPYVFTHKGIPLPLETHIDYRSIPSNFERWDDELQDFTREYKNERITRDFGVEQRIVANSAGGCIIESRPFFSLFYRQGYDPFMVTRSLGAYVSCDEDMDRIPLLIRYIPDPTPDRRINSASSFPDAFARLHEVSHHIDYGDFETAGLSKNLTHDVIMLSGVPVHEIFGHQFEEPIYPLQVGRQSLFPVGKNVQNSNIVLRDNPLQKVEELEVFGSYHYDCYGRPAKETVHISDSTVHDHLGSEYVDMKNLHTFLGIDHSPFSGNARQGNEGYFPQTRMSCTILDGKQEEVDWEGKLVMIPFDGYVLDGNFFKILASECYVIDAQGKPRRVAPMEGSRAIYDAIIGMRILPGRSYHVGSCSKPEVLEERAQSEVMVSFFTNHQLWERLTLRPL
ncbi:MAG: hypothetical protein C4527_17120 [Candidatus Omnitrophota bacterium]|jgi:hypothetical protein|nr:MAG: hypothetical protein C4527_17120 [Candidatus Omnitrophota bacterium]